MELEREREREPELERERERELERERRLLVYYGHEIVTQVSATASDKFRERQQRH